MSPLHPPPACIAAAALPPVSSVDGGAFAISLTVPADGHAMDTSSLGSKRTGEKDPAKVTNEDAFAKRAKARKEEGTTADEAKNEEDDL